MIDYIRRDEAIIKGMEVALEGLNTPLKIKAAFDEIPAADVVEMVRCKDCRECMEFTPEYKRNGDYGTCRRLLFIVVDDYAARVQADGFCSYGKHKEGKE